MFGFTTLFSVLFVRLTPLIWQGIQIDNIAEASPGNDLISAGGSGNSTAAKSESLVKPGVSDDRPICEVTKGVVQNSG